MTYIRISAYLLVLLAILPFLGEGQNIKVTCALNEYFDRVMNLCFPCSSVCLPCSNPTNRLNVICRKLCSDYYKRNCVFDLISTSSYEATLSVSNSLDHEVSILDNPLLWLSVSCVLFSLLVTLIVMIVVIRYKRRMYIKCCVSEVPKRNIGGLGDSLIYNCKDSDSFSLTSKSSYYDDQGNKRNNYPERFLAGAAVINSKLYIALKQSDMCQVLVSDIGTFAPLGDIKIPNLLKPKGLVGCSDSKQLYISDFSGQCIHCINVLDNAMTEWKLRNCFIPCGLSLTSDSTLLVTAWIRNSDGESIVIEFSNKGNKIREIYLDVSIDWAVQAERLSYLQYVVCHGVRDSMLHRVCIVNPRGEILTAIGEQMGLGGFKLKEPSAISVDKKCSSIFMADTGNDRILSLDFELNYLGEVDTSRPIQRPSHVYFDSKSKKLIIIEEESSKPIILVNFELKQ